MSERSHGLIIAARDVYLSWWPTAAVRACGPAALGGIHALVAW